MNLIMMAQFPSWVIQGVRHGEICVSKSADSSGGRGIPQEKQERGSQTVAIMGSTIRFAAHPI